MAGPFLPVCGHLWALCPAQSASRGSGAAGQRVWRGDSHRVQSAPWKNAQEQEVWETHTEGPQHGVSLATMAPRLKCGFPGPCPVCAGAVAFQTKPWANTRSPVPPRGGEAARAGRPRGGGVFCFTAGPPCAPRPEGPYKSLPAPQCTVGHGRAVPWVGRRSLSQDPISSDPGEQGARPPAETVMKIWEVTSVSQPLTGGLRPPQAAGRGLLPDPTHLNSPPASGGTTECLQTLLLFSKPLYVLFLRVLLGHPGTWQPLVGPSWAPGHREGSTRDGNLPPKAPGPSPPRHGTAAPAWPLSPRDLL